MEEQKNQVVESIYRLREQIRWKPGSGIRHLNKRIELGHLEDTATITSYETLITRVVTDSNAAVFLYRWGEAQYPTVVAEIEGVRWLVMVDLDGIMETAFPPDDPEGYLANPRFTYLGTLNQITRDSYT